MASSNLSRHPLHEVKRAQASELFDGDVYQRATDVEFDDLDISFDQNDRPDLQPVLVLL